MVKRILLGMCLLSLAITGCKAPDYDRLPQNTSSESSDPFFGKDSRKGTTQSNDRSGAVLGTLTSNPRPGPNAAVPPSPSDLAATLSAPSADHPGSASKDWTPTNNSTASPAFSASATSESEEIKQRIRQKGVIDLMIRQIGTEWVSSCDMPKGTGYKHIRVAAATEQAALQSLLQQVESMK